MIAGFYISVVTFGNHEREKRFHGDNIDTFLQHQLETTVSYYNSSDLM